MKKRLLTILIIAAISTSSCTIFMKSVYLNSTSIDYSSYPDFFITESNSVSFPYEPVASVNAIFLSGFNNISNIASDNVYTTSSATPKTKYIQATRKGALDELVYKTMELKANGIINLKITSVTSYTKDAGLVVEGYEASGMAIKK